MLESRHCSVHLLPESASDAWVTGTMTEHHSEGGRLVMVIVVMVFPQVCERVGQWVCSNHSSLSVTVSGDNTLLLTGDCAMLNVSYYNPIGQL